MPTSAKKPLVVVTRKLPDVVESRMCELFDVRLREGGDAGAPLVLEDPAAPAAEVLRGIAGRLGSRPRGLAGMSLGLTPASRF